MVKKRPFSVDFTGEVSMTKQSFEKECDINEIVKRFERSGLVTHLADKVGFYGDVASVPDYQSSLNIVARAGEYFAALPASIRERFGNDPGQLVEFLNDPGNKAEAIELGILEKEKAPGEPAGSVPPVVAPVDGSSKK